MGSSVADEADETVVVIDDAIRVLVVGNEPLSRRGMAEMLDEQDDLDVVAALRSEVTLRQVGRLGAHVAVVLHDDVSGLDLCRRLSIRRPPVGVVVANSFRSAEQFVPYREAGVQGFVRTDSPTPVVTEAVLTVASDHEFHDPGIPDEPPNPYGLTGRQWEVLALLVLRLTNAEIAERLSVSEYTVKEHVSHIYAKLGVHSRGKAKDVALREGLV